MRIPVKIWILTNDTESSKNINQSNSHLLSSLYSNLICQTFAKYESYKKNQTQNK